MQKVTITYTLIIVILSFFSSGYGMNRGLSAAAEKKLQQTSEAKIVEECSEVIKNMARSGAYENMRKEYFHSTIEQGIRANSKVFYYYSMSALDEDDLALLCNKAQSSSLFKITNTVAGDEQWGINANDFTIEFLQKLFKEKDSTCVSLLNRLIKGKQFVVFTRQLVEMTKLHQALFQKFEIAINDFLKKENALGKYVTKSIIVPRLAENIQLYKFYLKKEAEKDGIEVFYSLSNSDMGFINIVKNILILIVLR